MIDKQQTADLFYRALKKIIRDKGTFPHKIQAQLELLVHLVKIAVQDTGMQFHTLFSLIAFTGHKYNIPGRLIYNIHRFRKQATRNRRVSGDSPNVQQIYNLGLRVLADCVQIIFNERPSTFILANLPSDEIYLTRPDSVVAFRKYLRVLVLENKSDEDTLIAIETTAGDRPIKVRYNLPDKNENFNASIALLGKEIRLPAEINLIDVEIDAQEYYLPKAFVIEPDFLIDITAIADASLEREAGDLAFLVKKFLPVEPNKYLLLGHIANFFLDEIMGNPDLDFRDLIHRVFALNPVAFSLFDDATAREIVQKAQKHFINLKMVVKRSLPKHGIAIEHCFLEPTFYSERYGIQGRLDVLHDNPDIVDDASIIELKSGNPFRPNVYGLSHNHYIQTLLYDLLIKSASDDQLRPTNYILYSAKDVDHLRFAPAVRSQQYEALAIRNLLIATEKKLAAADHFLQQPASFLRMLESGSSKAKGFLVRDSRVLQDRFRNLNEIEQKYFIAMMGLIAREHHLSKLGIEGERRNNGQAALWLNELTEKQQEYNIISYLKIQENKVQSSEPSLTLRYSGRTNPLANFRKGDLAILYPHQENATALQSQLFKGTVIELGEDLVKFRLRAKQFNSSIFSEFEYWHVEHDTLDSSFIGLYRALFYFTGFEPRLRQKFLTLKPPAPSQSVKWHDQEGLTTEQNEILRTMLAAQDYFLLWGPPGTGKTSIVLRHLVQYLLHHSEEKILLLAYTNRAVDEICWALEKIGSPVRDRYLRIGSRHACDHHFIDQLLSQKMQHINSRDELRKLLQSQRIIVGTAASISGKTELFNLLQFDRVIIDEATQMLEPVMAGLLPRFQKAVLIGDHRQLAAVVTQNIRERKVSDISLAAIGIQDLGDSYFERVYRRCQEEGWHWAYAKLSKQGRMHQDLMAFPKAHFYDGALDILPQPQMQQIQTAPLPYSDLPSDPLARALASHRVLFIPVESDEIYRSKTNTREAHLVAEIVLQLKQLHEAHSRSWAPEDLGIIAPYRAQIARIRDALLKAGYDPGQTTIDTVERFQGGARKIIIISFCINSTQQLSSLISRSSDGKDRKLNVALTRAREQIISLGDPKVLGQDETYAAYIEKYKVAIPAEVF